jgi:hypothetical protein
MTPLAYAGQLGVSDVGKLSQPDREALKRMAADEMRVLGVQVDAPAAP